MANSVLEFTQFKFDFFFFLSVSLPHQSCDAIVNAIAGSSDLFPSSSL